MSLRLLACGEHAVLVELDGLTEVLALDAAVRAAVEAGDAAFANVVDAVPAARTLLLVVQEGADLSTLRAALPTLASSARPTSAQTTSTQTTSTQPSSAQPSSAQPSSARPLPASPPGSLEIGVHYDGPDLYEVSQLTGLTPREVVAAHTQTPWQVAFAGFSPGFAYLCGGDRRLQVPRRSEPRTSVPAGSVGLAGEFSAVYPRSSPGGWQLLGHTDAVLWDVNRQPPALLQSGSVIRFVDLDADADADAEPDADRASR